MSEQSWEHHHYIEQYFDWDKVDKIQVKPDLNLWMVNLEHESGIFQSHSSELRRVVQQSDEIVLEYFPKEMSQSVSDVITGLDYFIEIAHLAQVHNKKITLVDPCYNDDFYKLVAAGGAGWIGSLATSVLTSLAAERVEHKMSRRHFLSLLAKGSAALGIGLSVTSLGMTYEHLTKQPLNNLPHYQAFRRVVVAKGVSQMSGNLAFFYPPAHNAGIQELLSDPETLDLKFNIAKQLKPALPRLFRHRSYDYGNNGWHLVTDKEID